jgi:hypothetical protein
MNICFYISDYGYGHASRDIAIIRRILDVYDDVKRYIRTARPFSFVRQSLPQKNIEVIQRRNGVRVIFREPGINVDREWTKKMLDKWIASWNKYIQTEKAFCNFIFL